MCMFLENPWEYNADAWLAKWSVVRGHSALGHLWWNPLLHDRSSTWEEEGWQHYCADVVCPGTITTNYIIIQITYIFQHCHIYAGVPLKDNGRLEPEHWGVDKLRLRSTSSSSSDFGDSLKDREVRGVKR